MIRKEWKVMTFAGKTISMWNCVEKIPDFGNIKTVS